MRKIVFLFCFVVLFFSCKTTQKAVENNIVSERSQIAAYVNILDRNVRDSVILRDSVVVREDGSVLYREKSRDRISRDFKNVFTYYYLNIKECVRISNKTTITVTKTKYKTGFFWYFGFVSFLALIAFLVFKLNKTLGILSKLKSLLKIN